MKKAVLGFCTVMLMVILFAPTVGSKELPNIIRVENNFSFATASADIVNRRVSQKGLFKSKTVNGYRNLIVFGKSKGEYTDYAFDGALEYLIGADNRFIISFDSQKNLEKALDILEANENIAYVQQDYSVSTNSNNDTELVDLSWGPGALKTSTYVDFILNKPTARVVVAIVDSGAADIDCLKNRIVPGYDFVDNDIDPSNDTHPQSHGTFISSIIADCVKASNIKIMPIRVLGSYSGSIINAINGIIYAADSGADIINFSIGGVIADCKALDEAVNYATEEGSMVVVSAGNKSIDVETYCPAHNENAIVVGSVNSDLQFSGKFSNYGKTIDLVAPGEKINGYNANGKIKSLSGTSMSAAFVSACAALIKSSNPKYTSEQIQSSLRSCCRDLGEDGWDEYYGFGFPQMDVLAASEKKQIICVDIVCPPDKSTYYYKHKQKIDLTGIVISVTYADGTILYVDDPSELTYTNIDTDKLGNQKITICYKNKSTDFTVNVKYAWWQIISKLIHIIKSWFA